MSQTKRAANVVICTPAGYTVNSNYMVSLMFMLLRSMQWNKSEDKRDHPYDYIDAAFVLRQGSMLAQMRDECVQRALDTEDATHLLFVDSDMVFPAETLIELLRHDTYVVACNCPVKTLPTQPTVRMRAGDGQLVALNQRDARKFQSSLQKVYRIGTGIMLINLNVFRMMQPPYFEFSYDKEHKKHVGEDWTFCQKLDELNIPIYVDFAVSDYVGHVGDLIYTHDMDGADG